MVDNRRNIQDSSNNNSKSYYVNELQRIWMNEKICKDLLKFNEELIDKITNLIDEKEKELNQLKKKEPDLELHELDIERVKFLLKDYFRIRLKKIDRYLFYIVLNDKTTILSKPEFDYTLELYKLKKNYFYEYIFRKLPAKLNDFHVANSNNEHVLVQADETDYSAFRANNDITINLKDINENIEEIIYIKKNDIAFLPQKLLMEKLENNEIDFL